MTKKIINIGDKFGTWEIIGMEENDRKYNYNYICRCECGHKRMIRKDKLVNFTFPLCDRCNSNGLIKQKWDLIKSKWDETVNGKLIVSELEIRKKYMWRCPEGHLYYDTIETLGDGCPVCYELLNRQYILEKNREFFEFAINFMRRICEQVSEDTTVTALDADLMVAKVEVNDFIILMFPNHYSRFNSILHGNKMEYYDKLGQIKKYRNSVINDKREHIFLELNLNPVSDSKKIENILSKIIFK